ncbi:MAG: glycosyltransferase [Armatimonadota bacterium]|nr:glycosyltransferase [bacterium]
MKIALFGQSLLSSHLNPHIIYFRGLVRALHDRGHSITFYEPDAFDRQNHRDFDKPDWAEVVIYPCDGEDGVRRALDDAREADVIIKASKIGVFDELLESAVPDIKRQNASCAFWDVDAPGTLDRLEKKPDDPLKAQIPHYDLVLTHSGGDAVQTAYKALGARKCVPIHDAIDPHTHHHVTPESRFSADMGFHGDRLPGREHRVEEFLFGAARELPYSKFALAGSGWIGKYMPENIKLVGEIYSWDHNAFNSTPLTILNVAWESVAHYGFSPASRVFEAVGAQACVISEHWDSLEKFFEPGKEILVASSGVEVARHMRETNQARALAIGIAACRRALADHTYAHRATELEAALT